ncbi:MAG: N-6 DNA methylase [Prevotella sp.]|nr:N-6 DNA methylase [Prevotella sp.]
MLLQRNIVKKYLNLLGEEQTAKPWEQYQRFFLNEDIQANIHKIKEEQFQEGFLRELFVKVLGYTINPSPNYNLTTEQKNEVGAKKADGAILIDGKVIGVIELKDHKTPDLASIELQAFGYKSKQRDTRLVIISNFEKLRLYIDNAVEFREWDIFHITAEEFRELYLCLAWEQVKHGVALQMKQESVSSEDQITKALYRDYSHFKRVLFADILKNNPLPLSLTESTESTENCEKTDEKEWQLLLFKKTQKLLDRLLFIFFAEDCGLLPPNSMVQIIEQWEKLKELDAYVPFYERLKKYFGYMNTGFQGKKYEIFAYNGGLFKPDEVLDSIRISDELLVEHTRRLAAYDFESDVDVNILGHIFENSLSEIEEVTQQIQASGAPLPIGEVSGERLSKRKQDGVFYTPQYITKYIVENTVGRLCAEKKQQLGIVEDEYLSDQRRQLQTRKRLLDQLKQYREWLLQITILDPACGSGAFLNAALQFLMKEHKLIDEMEAKVTGSAIVFQDVENSILEHNLYGVDINEESVEIAQLALWLRTAKPHRKLNSLNKNIKCGNSLISDPAIAGDKAFDWQKEFPQVFEKGGFDVVIGNPPYIPTERISSVYKSFYEQVYQSAYGRINVYPLFYERGLSLLKNNGLLGYITPYTIMKNQYYVEARRYILDNCNILCLVDFSGYPVFEDATVDSIILILHKHQPKLSNQYLFVNNIKDFTNGFYSTLEAKQSDIFQHADLSFCNIGSTLDFNRIVVDCVKLGEIVNFKQGIITGNNKKFLTKQEGNNTKKVITGSDFNRYSLRWHKDYVIYDINELHRPRVPEIFEVAEKLLLRQTGSYPICMIDTDSYYTLDTVHNGIIKDKRFNLKYVMCLVNSKLLRYLYESSVNESGKVFAQVKIIYIDPLPVKVVSEASQQPFIALADTMLSLNTQLQDKRTRFLRRLSDNLEGVKITTALQAFDQLDFKGLMAELKKQKIHIPVKEQDEWEDFFKERVADCQALSAQIKATDEEIDTKVFDLYGLTEEERKIVMEA